MNRLKNLSIADHSLHNCPFQAGIGGSANFESIKIIYRLVSIGVKIFYYEDQL